MRAWGGPAIGLAAILGLGAALLVGAAPAWAARIQGVVVDPSGRPVELASVAAPAHRTGVVTDANGTFVLDLPDGPVTLHVTQIGYDAARVEVLVASELAPLRIVLRDTPVPVEEVVVAASSFGTTGRREGATLRRMDVLTTPGGAADVFQALRALPGITAPDEGAAIYVRGGDPSETLVRLDGGEIGHPYHYRGASGGLFSAFDTYMIKSAYFSSGGFSARYGGALSGVLDVESQDPMNLKTVSLGANLVGGSVSTTWALIPDRLSFVGALRASNVTLLDRLYGATRERVLAPQSADGAGRLLWRWSPSGRLAALYLGGGDRTAVRTRELADEGVYSERASNHFGAIQVRELLAERVAVRGQLSLQRYAREWSFGPAAIEEREINAQANLEAVWTLSPLHRLEFGANLRRRSDRIAGAFPADSTDLGDGAPVRFHDTNPTLDHPGVFVEHTARVWRLLYATGGARFDWVSTPGEWTADPRGALAWRASERQTFRLAAGRYHQPPAPSWLDPVYGNPLLRPLRADHLIAGWEWNESETNLRLEAYRKTYRDLVTQSAATFHDQRGHGVAQGFDAFARTRTGPISGWVSYGWLDSRRLEGDLEREAPSPHGARHSLTLVGAVQLPGAWQTSARYGWSSGRPYTPIVAAVHDPERDRWRPIEGDPFSGTLPDHHRLDLRVLRLFSLPAGLGLPASSLCVLYVEAMNALGIANVVGYEYDTTFAERTETRSYFSRRMLVVGTSLTW